MNQSELIALSKKGFTKDNQLRTNSDLILTAQYAKLFQLSNDYLLPLTSAISILESNKNKQNMLSLVLDLQLSAGLRVSEAIDFKNMKINRLGQIYTSGKKGSHGKLITPLFHRYFVSSRANRFVWYDYELNRFAVYRFYKSNGIYGHFKTNTYDSVTHSMRYMHVLLMQLMELPTNEISRLLGHKNYNNIKYYLSNATK